MPLSAVKRDIVIRNPRVAHSENTRMWAEKKLFAFLTTNSVPQPDPWRVRPGKSASRQLVQCIAAGWVPAWKGVYRAESIVSRSTAFWGGRYAFEAFRVRRPAEFPEPRFSGVRLAPPSGWPTNQRVYNFRVADYPGMTKPQILKSIPASDTI